MGNPEETLKIGQEVMAQIEDERRAAFAKAFPIAKFAKELAILFFSDIADYTGNDGGGDYVKSLLKIRPQKKTKAIKKIKITELRPVMTVEGGELISRETQKIELELYDKVSVARLVADVMGLNAPQKTELSMDRELHAIFATLPAGFRDAVREAVTQLRSASRKDRG